MFDGSFTVTADRVDFHPVTMFVNHAVTLSSRGPALQDKLCIIFTDFSVKKREAAWGKEITATIKRHPAETGSAIPSLKSVSRMTIQPHCLFCSGAVGPIGEENACQIILVLT